jgi:hypothetical protein
MSIFMYRLSWDGVQRIELPRGARPLSVAVADSHLCFYALVVPSDEPSDLCTLRIYGTYADVEVAGPYERLPEADNLVFLGTAVSGKGVHHVFYTMQRSVPFTVFGRAEPIYRPVEGGV